MAERHTTGRTEHYPERSAPGGGRSRLLAASADLPFRPYVYRGWDRDEPPAVTAARDRHREVDARLALRDAAMDRAGLAAWADPDGGDPEGPGWEWYRERAIEETL